MPRTQKGVLISVCLILCVACLCGTRPAHGGPHVSYALLEDPEHALTIHDVASEENALRFKPITSKTINIGYTRSAFWIRGRISDRDAASSAITALRHRILVLTPHYPVISESHVFWRQQTRVADGSWRILEPKAGDLLYKFDLSGMPNSQRTFYIRIASQIPLFFSMDLKTGEEYVDYIVRRKLSFGLYYGVLASMIAVNLFFFIYIRDRTYLWYLLHLFFNAVFFLHFNRLLAPLLEPRWPTLMLRTGFLSLGLVIVFGGLFARRFLDTRRLTPRLDRVILAVMATGGVSCVLAILFEYVPLRAIYSVLCLVIPLLIVLVGIACSRQRLREARFFLIAWGLYGAGLFLFFATVRNWLFYSTWNVHAFQIGSAAEAVILSLALFDRVGALRAAKDAAEKGRLEMERANALQRLILNNSGLGIAFLKDRKVQWVNDHLAKMFGASVESLLGQSTEIVYPSHSAFEGVGENLYTTLQGEGVFEEKMIFRRINGTTFSAHVSARTVEPANPKQGAVVLIRDLSEREAERRGRVEAQTLLAGAMEQNPAGIIIVRASDFEVQLLNLAAAKILGIERTNDENLTTQCAYLDCFVRDGQVFVPARFPLREAAQAGRTQRNMEMMVRRNDNDTRRILLNTSPIYAENGELLAGVIVFTDVTRQREMELQLRQSEKMQAIGKLAGGIAHDFNNQLAGIMGYAELLKLESTGGESQKYAEMICLATQRAADLTNELLAFARKGRYRLQPVDLNQLIDEVTALLSRTIDKRISIESNRCEEAAAMGDPTQLQNALLNIAINARDAMPKGGVLTFRTRGVHIEPHDEYFSDATLEPGEYIRLDISDTGIGMEEDVRQRIFEPFFTTKPSGEGTGMGLAAVYGTIQSHKGHISVRTAPGEGTTFSMLLPRCTAPTPMKETLPGPAARGNANAHILIVDDEDVVRNVSTEMLRNLGYRVTACEGGAQALTVYSEKWREVDIVLLDMIMPDMNGSEVFKALQAINPKVKVLLCSGFSLSSDAQHILQNGATGFLGKPYTIRTLAEKLTEALAHS